MSENEQQGISYGELVDQLAAVTAKLESALARLDDIERLNHSQEATISAARATADEARSIAMANAAAKGGDSLVSIDGDEIHITHPSGRLKFRLVQRDGSLDFIPRVDPI